MIIWYKDCNTVGIEASEGNVSDPIRVVLEGALEVSGS